MFFQQLIRGTNCSSPHTLPCTFLGKHTPPDPIPSYPLFPETVNRLGHLYLPDPILQKELLVRCNNLIGSLAMQLSGLPDHKCLTTPLHTYLPISFNISASVWWKVALYQRRLEHKQHSHDCCHSWNFIVPFPNQIFCDYGSLNLEKPISRPKIVWFMLDEGIRGRIVWTIFECTEHHQPIATEHKCCNSLMMFCAIKD